MVAEIYSETPTLDRRVHRIDLVDEFTRFILCFPKETCNELWDRASLLIKTGFTYFIEYGKNILGYHVIGKGYSSITVLAHNKYYGEGLLKIRRLDSRRKSLEYEGMIMDFLDKTSCSPRLYMWSRDFIFMEYLGECISIEQVLTHTLLDRKYHVLYRVLLKTFTTLYLLDFMGIDHGELNRPYNHILWCNNSVKIIDWESSRFSRKTHNLTSFTSYLINRFKYSDQLLEITGVDREDVISLLKSYKKKPSIRELNAIIKLLVQPLLQIS